VSASKQERARANTSEREQTRASTSKHERARANKSEREQTRASASKQERARANLSGQGEREHTRASACEWSLSSIITQRSACAAQCVALRSLRGREAMPNEARVVHWWCLQHMGARWKPSKAKPSPGARACKTSNCRAVRHSSRSAQTHFQRTWQGASSCLRVCRCPATGLIVKLGV